MAHSTNSSATSRWVIFLFGVPFFAMGCGFMWFMGLKPLVLSLQSSDWPQVACQVASSRLGSSTDSDGSTTYKVDITLRYTFENINYTGGRYNFNQASSSGREGKAAVVNNYPVGKQAICWVNPNRPEQAVLNREIPGMVWFVLPFTSIFVVIGALFMGGALGWLPSSWSKTSHSRVTKTATGYTVLKPNFSPSGKVMMYAFAMLFWNGIVGVFVHQAWQSYTSAKTEWGLILFLIPFVLIGLFLLGLFVRACLATFNPKAQLSLSEGRPKLGELATLAWSFTGQVSRIQKLTITVEGREKASYSVGTDRRTDTHVFYKKVLVSTSLPNQVGNQSVTLTIPADSMHSFTSHNNQIEWVILLHGDVPSWADVDDEYPITVRPI